MWGSRHGLRHSCRTSGNDDASAMRLLYELRTGETADVEHAGDGRIQAWVLDSSNKEGRCHREQHLVSTLDFPLSNSTRSRSSVNAVRSHSHATVHARFATCSFDRLPLSSSLRMSSTAMHQLAQQAAAHFCTTASSAAEFSASHRIPTFRRQRCRPLPREESVAWWNPQSTWAPICTRTRPT